MSEEPTTPRRSSRIIQTRLSVKPVRSFKRVYAWSWPQESLNTADVDVPDEEEAQAFFAAIIRRNPPATKLASTATSHLRDSNGKKRPITGAKKGDEETFCIGDTVLVDTQNSSYPSVGVIVALWQPYTNGDSELNDADVGGDSDDGNDTVHKHEKWWERIDNNPQPRIRVHWFVQPSELPKVRAPRDHAANEIYYSLDSTTIISPTDILAHCAVSDDPMDASDLGDSDSDEHNFCCFYAINAEKGVFYAFNWQSHRDKATHSQRGKAVHPNAWVVVPRDEDIHKATPAQGNKGLRAHYLHPRKKRRLGGDDESAEDSGIESSIDDSAEDFQLTDVSESDDEGAASGDDSASPEPNGPRKRRRGALSTPAKARGVNQGSQIFQTPTKQKRFSRPVVPSPTKPSVGVAPTPHSKAVLRTRQKLKTRRATAAQRLAAPELSVTDAKTLTHLPKDAQLRAMHVLHVGSRPDSLPSREEEFADILEKVLVLLEDGVGGCVYISGVPGTGKTATVHAVVRELHGMAKRNDINPFTYVEINGLKIPEPAAAYGVLWESLSRHDVAVEGHLRISSKEALRRLDRHFSGSGNAGPGSHACIVLMDELDQLVTTKQDVVYNFFNWPTLANSKLIVLAVANTMDLPERAMTGKVRSRLGMARVDFRPYKRDQLESIVHARLKAAAEGLDGQTTVMEPDAIKLAAARVAAVSGDARRVLDVCRRAVEVCHAKKVGAVKTKTISEVMAEMQNSPTASYVRDCSFHERVMLAAVWKCLKRTGLSVIKWDDIAYQHVNLVTALAQDLDSQRRLSLSELLHVLDSLTATRALLIEDVRKGVPDGERKVMLNLEEAEVLRVLGETGGPKWRSFLGI